MKKRLERIGIFGGTFNPPHTGHLIVAEHVREVLGLDKIFFVPSYISPHKQAGEEALAIHRLAMVRLAVRGNKFFDFADLEINQGGTSYTYKTVESFHQQFPSGTLFLMMGADNFVDFHTWKKPERIVARVTVVAMTRPTYKAARARRQFSAAAKFVTVPDIQISSTGIRNRVKQGKAIRYLVPENIENYIVRHRLYR
jgi:nicotinate-nucleotide adenylyltransferase